MSIISVALHKEGLCSKCPCSKFPSLTQVNFKLCEKTNKETYVRCWISKTKLTIFSNQKVKKITKI